MSKNLITTGGLLHSQSVNHRHGIAFRWMVTACALAVSGCGEMEWNPTWWTQPTRIVRPSPRPQQAPAARDPEPVQQETAYAQVAEPAEMGDEPRDAPEPPPRGGQSEHRIIEVQPMQGRPQAGSPQSVAQSGSPSVQPAAGVTGATRQPVKAEPVPVRPAAQAVGTTPQQAPAAKPEAPGPKVVAAAPTAAPRTPPPVQPSVPSQVQTAARTESALSGTGTRVFYNLYLRSEAPGAEDQKRGEMLVYLENVGARTCAQTLEVLYVPTGRPGSLSETYLIFENRGEFDAASAFVPKLDIMPAAVPEAATGSQGNLRAALAMYLEVIESGVVVEEELIQACEQRLLDSSQASDLSPVDRWAAAVLAGRLAAAYRYDQVAAKEHYEQAEKIVPAGSIEAMTCRWWLAEALTEQGKPSEAALVYEGIVSTFGTKFANSHIVRRAKAMLEQKGKR